MTRLLMDEGEFRKALAAEDYAAAHALILAWPAEAATQSKEAYLLLLRTARRQRQMAVLAEYLAKAPRRLLGLPRLQLEAGYAARARGDDAAALKHFAAAGTPGRLQGAVTLAGLGQAAEARSLLQAFLADQPAEPSAWRLLGDLEQAEGRWSEAAQAYAAARNLAPGRIAAWQPLVELLLARDDQPALLQALAAITPVLDGLADPQPFHRLGLRLALAAGDLAAAQAHLDAQPAPEPGDVLPLLQAQRLAGALEAAQAILDRLLASHPQVASLQQEAVLLALAHIDRLAATDRVAAMAAATALAERWPERPEARGKRLELGLTGRNFGALIAQIEALPEAAERVAWGVKLLQRLRRSNRLETAEAMAQRLLQAEGEAVPLLEAAGVVARQRGNHALAYARFAAAHRQGADAAAREMAREALQLDRHAEAAALLQPVVAAHPQDRSAWLWLAEAQQRLDPEAALRTYAAGCAQAPDYERLWRGRAELAARFAGMEAGLAILALAEAQLPRQASLLRLRIRFLLKLGLEAEAAALLAEVEADFAADGGLRDLAIELHLDRCDFAAALPRIETLPVETPAERARQARFRGRYHALRWEIEPAEAAFRAALAAHPLEEHAAFPLTRLCILTQRAEEGFAVQQEHSRRKRARGASSNPNQGLAGALVNELRIDPAPLAVARAAREAGDHATLARLVRDNPHNTGTAIALLAGWRFDRGLPAGVELPAAAGGRPIPASVIQYWDEDAPPEDLQRLMASWPQLLPGWAYRCFSHRQALAWLQQHATPEVMLAYRRAREPARKSDILRLAVLLRDGGVYADADDRCLKDLTPLLAGRSLVLWQEQFGTAGNNFIAVIPGHPVIAEALAQATLATLEGYSGTLWLETGPGAMSRALASHLAAQADPLGPLDRGEILLLDTVAMRRHVAFHLQAAYKSAGRHWVRDRHAW
ncbi:glycosyltransferase [Roseomonas sp. 18066]|uniref:glycosyltransferase n=1 Tax=Roseomonas sp. 18066 TaxID=2681412 RepID=UPI00135B9CC0|nr:glycosyltransferase [Roseomonas sp. 18066]